ncbi:MAG TPA: T9SS type A sorting domain-containing protein [Saprospiraceae bacterium]|nr:T9SS type A sorting domain-containing protein [Saprospiraceae bacterium]
MFQKYRVFFLIMVLYSSLSSTAQNQYDAVWMMGANGRHLGSIEDRDLLYNNMFFDFSRDTIKFQDFRTTPIGGRASIGEMMISIASTDGELNYYGNGSYLQSAIDTQIMKGGDSLHADNYLIQDHPGPIGYNQHTLILPSSKKEGRFHHIFNDHSRPTEEGVHATKIYHFVVDMEANEGKGEVVIRDSIYYGDVLLMGGLTAVRHGNDRDWWIMKKRKFVPEILLFHFSDEEERILDTVIYRDSILYIDEEELRESEGQLTTSVFSPQGDQFAICDFMYGIRLFDFDRHTGQLSNSRAFDHVFDIDNFNLSQGCAFSSDGSKLYYTDQFHLFQFETDKMDLFDGLDTIAELSELNGVGMRQMSLAPDCRIYMANGQFPSVNIIMHPNRDGKACELRPKMPIDYLSHNMCYYPNYRLGTVFPFCDSTKVLPPEWRPVSNQERVVRETLDVRIYPNPASGVVQLEAQSPIDQVEVLDFQGRPVGVYERTTSLDLSHQPAGLYFLRITSREGQVTKKLILQR